MSKWLILDRDGVINHDSDHFIKSPTEWRPLPGSLEAIAKLNRAGYRVVVISNQSGIARGLLDMNTLDAIHDKFTLMLKDKGGTIERIYFCPHGPDDACDCRKPLPGLFLRFSHDYADDNALALKNIWAVGDSVRDLQAAVSAKARCALVRTGKGIRSEQVISQLPSEDALHAVPVFDDLAAFTTHLLS